MFDSQYEVIASKELGRRWAVPETWIRNNVRKRVANPIPHVRLGKYVRFEWGSPELQAWWDKQKKGGSETENRLSSRLDLISPIKPLLHSADKLRRNRANP